MSHLDALFAVALHMTKHRQDAEDLVQDTYVRAFRGLDEHRGDVLSKAWLFRIMRNAFIDGYRRDRSRPPLVALDEASTGRTPDASTDRARFVRSGDVAGEVDRLVHRTVSDEVRSAIDALPEPFRLTLVLRDLAGFTYGEIAEILDVPAGTVMSRLHRARRSLRGRLLEYVRDRAGLPAATVAEAA